MIHSKEPAQNLLVFQSSGLDCAFPLEAVQEIVPMALLSSPPGLPSGLAGFLDLRGDSIPILRLDRLFGLAGQHPGLYTPLIILRGAGAPFGILVDSVQQIYNAPMASYLPLSGKRLFLDCATAMVEVNGSAISLLLPERILAVNECRLLAEFQTMALERLRQLEESR